MYGNYGLWSWLRYWYLDTAEMVTLMLLDKGYYDYDYERVKEKRQVTEKDTEIWSDNKVSQLFSTAMYPDGTRVFADAAPDAERLQGMVMEDMKER